MAGCRCLSMSVHVKKLTVVKATTSGSGFIEKLTGRFIHTDDVSFAAISNGVRLNFPPGGRRGWPENNTYSLKAGQSVPPDPVRVATVVPEGAYCIVTLTSVIQFFEKDWDSLDALLDQVVDEAVDKGLMMIPQYGGFVQALGKNIAKVLKDVLDALTSLKSEKMGTVVVQLDAHSLDDPRPLDQLPWGQEMDRAKMKHKTQDSFEYHTTLKNWGGQWDVELLISRNCLPSSSSSSSSSSSPGWGSSSSSSGASHHSSSSGGSSSSSGRLSSSSGMEDVPNWVHGASSSSAGDDHRPTES